MLRQIIPTLEINQINVDFVVKAVELLILEAIHASMGLAGNHSKGNAERACFFTREKHSVDDKSWISLCNL